MAGASSKSLDVCATAPRTSASASESTLLRNALLSGESRSSLSARIIGRSVSPLTNSVNRTNPVARTATRLWVAASMRPLSVTASASASVTAPRKPPHDGQIIGRIDVPAQLECAQDRKNSEQNGGSRRKCAHDHQHQQ